MGIEQNPNFSSFCPFIFSLLGDEVKLHGGNRSDTLFPKGLAPPMTVKHGPERYEIIELRYMW
jgi:hypothetical protein